MKCENCGFPLSPARSQCPRCGVSVGKGQVAAPVQPTNMWSPAPAFTGSESHPAWTPADAQMAQQGQWGMPTPPEQGSNAWGAVPTFSDVTPTTPPQMPGYFGQGQGGFAGSGGLQQPQAQGQATFFPPTPAPSLPTRRGGGKRSSRLGFTIAGLCLTMGALILVFVYVMSLGLVRPDTSTTQNLQQTSVVSPTAVPSPTPAITPTPTFPGQQYIDNAQTASAVNTTTAQIITAAATFKTNQRIYVTFQVHPNGNSGGVCLLWYINSQQFSLYAFSVGTSATLAYSFAKVANAGSGYVEIYWSPQASCSDPNKVLSQRATFTVTA